MLFKTDDFTAGSLPSQWMKYDFSEPGGDPYGWFLAANAITSGGELQLRGRWDAAKGRWATGGVGRWNPDNGEPFSPPFKLEVDYKVSADADGYLYTFLMWPWASDWPAGGEIDYAEDISPNRDGINEVFHYSSNGQQSGSHLQTPQVRGSHDFTQWTTVAMEWTTGLIVCKINGVEFARVTGSFVPTRPMVPTLQMQANGASQWNNAASQATEGVHVRAMRFYNKG